MDAISNIRSIVGSNNMAVMMSMWSELHRTKMVDDPKTQEVLSSYLKPCVITVPWYLAMDLSRPIEIIHQDIHAPISKEDFPGAVRIIPNDRMNPGHSILLAIYQITSDLHDARYGYSGDRISSSVAKIMGTDVVRSILDASFNRSEEMAAREAISKIVSECVYVTPNIFRSIQFGKGARTRMVDLDIKTSMLNVRRSNAQGTTLWESETFSMSQDGRIEISEDALLDPHFPVSCAWADDKFMTLANIIILMERMAESTGSSKYNIVDLDKCGWEDMIKSERDPSRRGGGYFSLTPTEIFGKDADNKKLFDEFADNGQPAHVSGWAYIWPSGKGFFLPLSKVDDPSLNIKTRIKSIMC